MPTQSSSRYSGSQRLGFLRRLGDSWSELAVYLDIPEHEYRRFTKGDEAWGLWQWLTVRHRLDALPEAVRVIGRDDLAELLVPSLTTGSAVSATDERADETAIVAGAGRRTWMAVGMTVMIAAAGVLVALQTQGHQAPSAPTGAGSPAGSGSSTTETPATAMSPTPSIAGSRLPTRRRVPLSDKAFYDLDTLKADLDGGPEFELQVRSPHLFFGELHETWDGVEMLLVSNADVSYAGCSRSTLVILEGKLNLEWINWGLHSACVRTNQGRWAVLNLVHTQGTSVYTFDLEIFEE